MVMELRCFMWILLLLTVTCGGYCQDLLDEQTSEDKNSPFYYTTTRNGTCVKIFYTGEDFYKVYCFGHLKTFNGSLGLITDKNHTITRVGYGNNSECFNVYKPKQKHETTVCLNVTTDNCIELESDEPHRTTKKIQQIPCNRTEDSQFLGLQFEELNIIFKCVVYSIETPNLSSDNINDTIHVKYCYNRKIVNEEEKKDISAGEIGFKLLNAIFKRKNYNEKSQNSTSGTN